MKKLLKRIACFALAAVTVFPAAACGGTNKPREDVLKITVSNLGFGTNWLYSIAEEFERAYDVEVDVTSTVAHQSMLQQLEVGYQLDDLCFFAGVSDTWRLARQGKFMNIDDVWSTTIEGEDKTIAEKALPELADAYKFQDHYYSMPFITELGGIAYNTTTLDTIFGKNNWTLPTTTVELENFCEEIKSKGAYPFVWSNKENSCYWGASINVWQAQYDGAKTYEGYTRASYWDEETNAYVLADTVEVAKEKILSNKGLLRAYEVGYKLVPSATGNSHQYCSSMTFTEAQAAFASVPYANDQKLVVFQNNGSWLYEESQEDFIFKNQTIGFMDIPVISSLVEKLSFYTDGEASFESLAADKRASYDEALSAIVAYVDGKTATKPTEIDGHVIVDADIERVREARGIVSIKDQAHVFIPYNAVNSDLAKKFLTFFASDYAGSVYQSVTHGFSPFYYKLDEDNTLANGFDRDVERMLNEATYRVGTGGKYGFYLSGGAIELNAGLSAERLYAKYVDDNSKKSAAGDVWTDKLINAGLKIL